MKEHQDLSGMNNGEEVNIGMQSRLIFLILLNLACYTCFKVSYIDFDDILKKNFWTEEKMLSFLESLH